MYAASLMLCCIEDLEAWWIISCHSIHIVQYVSIHPWCLSFSAMEALTRSPILRLKCFIAESNGGWKLCFNSFRYLKAPYTHHGAGKWHSSSHHHRIVNVRIAHSINIVDKVVNKNTNAHLKPMVIKYGYATWAHTYILHFIDISGKKTDNRVN